MDLCPIRLCRPSAVYRHTACASHRNGGTYVCDRNRERHTVSSSGGNSLPIQVLTVLSVTSQIRAFSVLPFVYYAVPWGFSVLPPSSAAGDVPGVRERNQPVSLLPGRRFPAVLAAFSVRCFRVASCTNDTEARAKNPPASAPVLH